MVFENPSGDWLPERVIYERLSDEDYVVDSYELTDDDQLQQITFHTGDEREVWRRK